MKKVFIFIFLLTLIAIEVDAQLLTNVREESKNKYSFHNNEKAINLSVELLTTYDFTNNLNGFTTSEKSGPSIQLEYEYAVADQLSLAGLFHYNDLTIELPYLPYARQNSTGVMDTVGLSLFTNCIFDPSVCGASIRKRVTVYSFGGKLKYHVSIIKNIDTYVSVNFDYSVIKSQTTIDPLIKNFVNEETINIDVPKFSYFMGLGARYFIASKIGLWSEVGLGKVSRFYLGISFKL